MNREAGKGSKARPFTVTKDTYSNNWERTFGKKPVKLENPLNQEVWYCNDMNDVTSIDGVDYIRVYKVDSPKRTFLMRKTSLNRVNTVYD